MKKREGKREERDGTSKGAEGRHGGFDLTAVASKFSVSHHLLCAGDLRHSLVYSPLPSCRATVSPSDDSEHNTASRNQPMSSLQGYVDRTRFPPSHHISSQSLIAAPQRPRAPRPPRWTRHNCAPFLSYMTFALTLLVRVICGCVRVRGVGRAGRLRPKIQRRPLRFQRAHLQHG